MVRLAQQELKDELARRNERLQKRATRWRLIILLNGLMITAAVIGGYLYFRRRRAQASSGAEADAV